MNVKQAIMRYRFHAYCDQNVRHGIRHIDHRVMATGPNPPVRIQPEPAEVAACTGEAAGILFHSV